MYSQFEAIAPCPVTTVPDEEIPLGFPVGPLQMLDGFCEVSMQPFLLQAEQSV